MSNQVGWSQIHRTIRITVCALAVWMHFISAADAILSNQENGEQTYQNTFEHPENMTEWTGISGEWALENGAYCQTTPGKGEYRYTLVSIPFLPRFFRVKATPIKANSYGFASFGFVISYQDDKNWVALRFGSYGSLSMLSLENGKKRLTNLAKFKAETGKTYEIALARRDNRIAVFRDHEFQCVVRQNSQTEAHRIGLFTESACSFDDLEVCGQQSAWLDYRQFVLEQAEQKLVARETMREAQIILKDGIFEDSFSSGSIEPWSLVKGTWECADSELRMISQGWARYIVLAPVVIRDGSIQGKATPTVKSVHGHAGFGVLVKWIDSANWVAVRYGQYGGVTVFSLKNGEKKIGHLGSFKADVDRQYQFAVNLTGGRLIAYCDGENLGSVPVPFDGQIGRPGLYTESPAMFEDIRVTEALPIPTPTPEPLNGNPKLSLEHASFRHAAGSQESDEQGGITAQGIAYLYIRNNGDGPAELQRVSAEGRDAQYLTSTVAWYRQRPFRIEPGHMGEIAVCFSALPLQLQLKAFEEPEEQLALPLTLEPREGKKLQVEIPVPQKNDPFQINFVGFAPSLERLFVYLQNRNAMSGNGNSSGHKLHLRSLSVNGEDMTSRTHFGSREIGREIVPLVVDLPSPLKQGQPIVVCVNTVEGNQTGYSVRAFPGTFQIQVTLLGKQTREDALKDIWQHNVTCVGLPDTGKNLLLEANKLGLSVFQYGGGIKQLRRLDQPHFPEITGLWLDEMDKRPIQETVSLIRECEETYREQGKFIPLQMINLCGSRSPQALKFYELGDAVCGAYGFYGASLGEGFGRVNGMDQREYRFTRRQFTPYFRDAEMPVVINPETGETIGRVREHRRCIEPREERWMTYACLIQGAKGIMHWNYGSGINPPPSWFSKEHTVIRASLGGALNHDPHGYKIPPDVAHDLQQTWDEIGRINTELRAIGPLIAISDVSRRAQVLNSNPERSPSGDPAVEAAALISGLDSVVLIVLNHTIKTNWTGNADRGIESYPPVSATVEVRLPPWLDPKQYFSVRYNGVEEVLPQRDRERLLFTFENLRVSEAIVITSRSDLMNSVKQDVCRLKDRLEGSGN